MAEPLVKEAKELTAIFTASSKTSKRNKIRSLQEKFPKLQILPTSAAKGEGIDDLKQALATRITGPEESVFAAI